MHPTSHGHSLQPCPLCAALVGLYCKEGRLVKGRGVDTRKEKNELEKGRKERLERVNEGKGRSKEAEKSDVEG